MTHTAQGDPPEKVNHNTWRPGKPPSPLKPLPNPTVRPWGLRGSSRVPGESQSITTSPQSVASDCHSKCPPRKKTSLMLHEVATQVLISKRQYLLIHVSYSLHCFCIFSNDYIYGLEQNSVYYQHCKYTERIERLPCKECNLLQVK